METSRDLGECSVTLVIGGFLCQGKGSNIMMGIDWGKSQLILTMKCLDYSEKIQSVLRVLMAWWDKDLAYEQRLLYFTVVLFTFTVQASDCSGLTWSKPLLLMHWLLMSPGHQQSWQRLCKMDTFLWSLRLNTNNPWHCNVKINVICKYISIFLQHSSALIELKFEIKFWSKMNNNIL